MTMHSPERDFKVWYLLHEHASAIERELDMRKFWAAVSVITTGFTTLLVLNAASEQTPIDIRN